MAADLLLTAVPWPAGPDRCPARPGGPLVEVMRARAGRVPAGRMNDARGRYSGASWFSDEQLARDFTADEATAVRADQDQWLKEIDTLIVAWFGGRHLTVSSDGQLRAGRHDLQVRRFAGDQFWVVAGGMSSTGDAPSDAYNELALLEDLGLFTDLP